MRLPDLLSFEDLQTLFFLEAVYRAIGAGKAYIDDNLVLGEISDFYIMLCEEYSESSDYELTSDAVFGPDLGRIISLIYDCISWGLLESAEDDRTISKNDSIPINDGSLQSEENSTIFRISQSGWDLLKKYAAEIIPQLIESIHSDISVYTDENPQSRPRPIGYDGCAPDNKASFSALLNSDLHMSAERQNPISLTTARASHVILGSANTMHSFSKMTAYMPNFSTRVENVSPSSDGKIYNLNIGQIDFRDFPTYEKILTDITDSMKPENYSRTLTEARNLFGYYLGLIKDIFPTGYPPGDREIGKIIEIIDKLERFIRAFRIRDEKRDELLAILRDRLLRLRDLSALIRTDS